jgi:excisionase family DNA binding protein
MTIQGELDLWPEPERGLVTIKQAARMLRLGRSTIYELIADRQLEVVHIGRSARVPVASIEALISRLRRASDRDRHTDALTY